MLFEPFGDLGEDGVGGYVDDGDDHFFFGFYGWRVLGHERVADVCPVDSSGFYKLFGDGACGCGEGEVEEDDAFGPVESG